MLGAKVDFALLLYDEFDGSPIADPGVLFRWGGRPVRPLGKREGFYVFRGLDPPDKAELEIERTHYHKAIKRVIKNRLDPGNPIVRVRLARSYPGRFSDCEWVSGESPPDADVLAFAEDERAKLGVGEENRVNILNCPAGRLTGRRFALDPKKAADTFLLTESPAPGVYLTDIKLPKGAKKVFRAYLSKSGPDGRYHIPVEFGQSGRISGTAYYDREAGKWVYASATERS